MDRIRVSTGIALLLLCALLPFLPATVAAEVGHVHFIVGAKFLDEDDWEPIETQPSLGIEAALGGEDWPVLIDLYLAGSTDEDEALIGPLLVNLDGDTTEFGVGVNKTWRGRGKFYPYLSGGLLFVNTSLKADGNEILDESGMGGWVGGGGYWRLGSHFNLGGTLRFSFADVDLDVAQDISAGGLLLGMTFGWGWPAAR